MRVIFLTLVIASCTIPPVSYATCPAGRCTPVVNNYSTYNDIKGVSAALAASSHVFEPRSHGFQWSVSGASYNDSTGVSAAIGHRINDNGLFLNVSVSQSDSEIGAAVGLRGKF